jgi:hypothetical protein
MINMYVGEKQTPEAVLRAGNSDDCLAKAVAASEPAAPLGGCSDSRSLQQVPLSRWGELVEQHARPV